MSGMRMGMDIVIRQDLKTVLAPRMIQSMEILQLSIADLQAKIDDNEMRIRKMQFAHTITPLENPMSIRSLRRDVARMKTELNKRESGLA